MVTQFNAFDVQSQLRLRASNTDLLSDNVGSIIEQVESPNLRVNKVVQGSGNNLFALTPAFADNP